MLRKHWQAREFRRSALASSLLTLDHYHHLVSQPLHKPPDREFIFRYSQLTWLTICWTSGVAGLVSDKPPGIIVAGNFSEMLGGSEEGSLVQSEQSQQASCIYTYTCVMESRDL